LQSKNGFEDVLKEAVGAGQREVREVENKAKDSCIRKTSRLSVYGSVVYVS
jgi:hypothetical protein